MQDDRSVVLLISWSGNVDKCKARICNSGHHAETPSYTT